MPRTLLFHTCSLLFAGLFLAGCGSSDGPALYPVVGTVTFDGQNIPEGRILFREVGAQQRGFGASIEDGRYALETTEGKMSVRITASRDVPGKFAESPAGPDEPQVPVREMYIPPKYNSRTELEVTVESSGTNQFDFDLNSRD